MQSSVCLFFVCCSIGVGLCGVIEGNREVGDNIAPDPLVSEDAEVEATIKEKRCPRERVGSSLPAHPEIVGASNPLASNRRQSHSSINQQLCKTCMNRHACRVLNNCIGCKTWCGSSDPPATPSGSNLNEAPQSPPSPSSSSEPMVGAIQQDPRPVNLASRFDNVEDAAEKKTYSVVKVEAGPLKNTMSSLLNISDASDIETLGCWATTYSNNPPVMNFDQQAVVGSSFFNNQGRELVKEAEQFGRNMKEELKKELGHRIKHYGKQFMSKEEVENLIHDVISQLPDNHSDHQQNPMTAITRSNFQDGVVPRFPLDSGTEGFVIPQTRNPDIIEGTPDATKLLRNAQEDDTGIANIPDAVPTLRMNQQNANNPSSQDLGMSQQGVMNSNVQDASDEIQADPRVGTGLEDSVPAESNNNALRQQEIVSTNHQILPDENLRRVSSETSRFRPIEQNGMMQLSDNQFAAEDTNGPQRVDLGEALEHPSSRTHKLIQKLKAKKHPVYNYQPNYYRTAQGDNADPHLLSQPGSQDFMSRPNEPEADDLPETEFVPEMHVNNEMPEDEANVMTEDIERSNIPSDNLIHSKPEAETLETNPIVAQKENKHMDEPVHLPPPNMQNRIRNDPHESDEGKLEKEPMTEDMNTNPNEEVGSNEDTTETSSKEARSHIHKKSKKVIIINKGHRHIANEDEETLGESPTDVELTADPSEVGVNSDGTDTGSKEARSHKNKKVIIIKKGHRHRANENDLGERLVDGRLNTNPNEGGLPNRDERVGSTLDETKIPTDENAAVTEEAAEVQPVVGNSRPDKDTDDSFELENDPELGGLAEKSTSNLQTEKGDSRAAGLDESGTESAPDTAKATDDNTKNLVGDIQDMVESNLPQSSGARTHKLIKKIKAWNNKVYQSSPYYYRANEDDTPLLGNIEGNEKDFGEGTDATGTETHMKPSHLGESPMVEAELTDSVKETAKGFVNDDELETATEKDLHIVGRPRPEIEASENNINIPARPNFDGNTFPPNTKIGSDATTSGLETDGENGHLQSTPQSQNPVGEEGTSNPGARTHKLIEKIKALKDKIHYSPTDYYRSNKPEGRDLIGLQHTESSPKIPLNEDENIAEDVTGLTNLAPASATQGGIVGPKPDSENGGAADPNDESEKELTPEARTHKLLNKIKAKNGRIYPTSYARLSEPEGNDLLGSNVENVSEGINKLNSEPTIFSTPEIGSDLGVLPEKQELSEDMDQAELSNVRPLPSGTDPDKPINTDGRLGSPDTNANLNAADIDENKGKINDGAGKRLGSSAPEIMGRAQNFEGDESTVDDIQTTASSEIMNSGSDEGLEDVTDRDNHLRGAKNDENSSAQLGTSMTANEDFSSQSRTSTPLSSRELDAQSALEKLREITKGLERVVDPTIPNTDGNSRPISRTFEPNTDFSPDEVIDEIKKVPATLLNTAEKTLEAMENNKDTQFTSDNNIVGSQPLESSLELYHPTFRQPNRIDHFQNGRVPFPVDTIVGSPIAEYVSQGPLWSNSFGALVPSATKNGVDPNNPKEFYFIGNGIKLPLNMVKKDDGVVHLSVDLDKLCSCKNVSCSKNHSAIEQTVGTILEKEAELKELVPASQENLADVPLGMAVPTAIADEHALGGTTGIEWTGKDKIDDEEGRFGVGSEETEREHAEVMKKRSPPDTTHRIPESIADILAVNPLEKSAATSKKQLITTSDVTSSNPLTTFVTSRFLTDENQNSKHFNDYVNQRISDIKSKIIRQTTSKNTIENAFHPVDPKTEMPVETSTRSKVGSRIKNFFQLSGAAKEGFANGEREVSNNDDSYAASLGSKMKTLFDGANKNDQADIESVTTEITKLGSRIRDFLGGSGKPKKDFAVLSPIRKRSKVSEEEGSNVPFLSSRFKQFYDRVNRGREEVDELSPVRRPYKFKAAERQLQDELRRLDESVNSYNQRNEMIMKEGADSLLEATENVVVKEEVGIMKNFLTWLRDVFANTASKIKSK